MLLFSSYMPRGQLPQVQRGPKPLRMVSIALAASLGVSVLALLVFAWLTQDVLRGRTLEFDVTVREFAYSHSSARLTLLLRSVSVLGSTPALIVLTATAALLFLRARWQRAAIWLLVTMAGASALTGVLKIAIARPHPVPFHVAAPETYSFPSGHALNSFCFYAVLAGLLCARIQRRILRIALWAGGAGLIAAVGWSRIYLGVHYPSDVIAGYAAAAVWVTALVTLDRLQRWCRMRRE